VANHFRDANRRRLCRLSHCQRERQARARRAQSATRASRIYVDPPAGKAERAIATMAERDQLTSGLMIKSLMPVVIILALAAPFFDVHPY
jgi:hypothetical protein